MDTYRAFILDENDRIVRAEVLSASTDEEAFAAARRYADGADIEIWHGRRRVARLPKNGAHQPENGA